MSKEDFSDFQETYGEIDGRGLQNYFLYRIANALESISSSEYGTIIDTLWDIQYEIKQLADVVKPLSP